MEVKLHWLGTLPGTRLTYSELAGEEGDVINKVVKNNFTRVQGYTQ